MAIALGCNYSQPLLTLLTSHAVDLDWIKVSVRERIEQELTDAVVHRPVLLHVLDRAGSLNPFRNGLDWKALERYVQTAGSPHHAIHLGLEPEDWASSINTELQTPAVRSQLMQRLVDGVTLANEMSTVPLLIENMPYYGWKGTVRLAVEPDTIHEIVEKTGVGLLLDLAHVRVTADHIGLDEREYLHALPLDKVREIHLAGPRYVPGEGLRDRHWELQTEDYVLFEHALTVVEPEIVTLEYGGTGPRFENPERNSLPALQRQLHRISGILSQFE